MHGLYVCLNASIHVCMVCICLWMNPHMCSWSVCVSECIYTCVHLWMCLQKRVVSAIYRHVHFQTDTLTHTETHTYLYRHIDTHILTYLHLHSSVSLCICLDTAVPVSIFECVHMHLHGCASSCLHASACVCGGISVCTMSDLSAIDWGGYECFPRNDLCFPLALSFTPWDIYPWAPARAGPRSTGLGGFKLSVRGNRPLSCPCCGKATHLHSLLRRSQRHQGKSIAGF